MFRPLPEWEMRRWKMPGCGSQAAALKWFAIIILG